MKKIVIYLLLIVLAINSGPVFSEEEPSQRAVLITGASTGIGRHAAEQLAGAGYFVYAGARKAGDIAELNKIKNIKAVRLDVTIQAEIDAVVKLIQAEGRGLWGLVNNAGINLIDPLIEAKESDLEFLFNVNVYGVFRVTKAFAPMIIESKGRIVNISSIAGVLSGGLHGYGMYFMSKHAIEAYTDQLSFEMAHLGVKVSAIEPGNFSTEIGNSRCKRMLAQSGSKKYRYYGEIMQRYLDRCKENADSSGPPSGPPPNLVSNAIQHALFDAKPKEHYLVVSNQFEAMITIGKALEELLNLNQNHEFSYTREQLISMMDEEWAILKGEKTRNWGDED